MSSHRGSKRKTVELYPEFDEAEEVLLAEELREPAQYKVLLHNDNYTTMEFVVQILMDIFRKHAEEATQIMLAIHKNGLGLCGIYPLEIAETKVVQVRHRAQEAGFPLRCTLEEAE